MLRRGLGPLQIQLISLGGIIGSCYFLGVGATIAENGFSTVIAFLIGGLIVWFVAMAMGELCVAMPREGSFVSHATELLGRPLGAGVGWSYWFNWCAYIPSEMVAGGMILHHFFPGISVMIWAALFGVVITGVNLLNVKYFGQIESFLALLKIGAIGVFCLVVLGILFGGNSTPSISENFQQKPESVLAFLATMVLVLVNFQGTELIALSAAETKDPEHSIPRAARNVAIRTIVIYVLPITLLLLVFPAQDARVDQSVFAQVLSRAGFERLALLFQLVIVSAALSCANSGLYGAVRSLYGLGKEGLAPKWVTHLNKEGIPSYATWITMAFSWVFLPLYIFFEGTQFYVWLLSVSGLTGAICWISISICQIRLRQRNKKPLSFKMPFYPYLSWASVGLQAVCMSFVVFHSTLRSALILGVPAFMIPLLICWFYDKRKTSS